MMIYGGPMMGMAINRLDIPVTKGCSGITVLEKALIKGPESACIRCGRCVDGLPDAFVPDQILIRSFRKGRYDDAEKLGRDELPGMRRVLLELPGKSCADAELQNL